MGTRGALAIVAGVLLVAAAVAWGFTSMLGPGAERIEDPFEQGLALYDLGEFAGAYAVWEPLALLGDARAQFQLGVLYREGEGVAVDEDEAFDWTLCAAEQGDAAAEYFVGRAFELGEGAPVDPEEALVWYVRAAASGYAEAQVTLGILYQAGLLTEPDPVEAMAWYLLAEEQGDPRGATGVAGGRMVLSPAGIERAERRARDIQDDAAAGRDVEIVQ